MVHYLWHMDIISHFPRPHRHSLSQHARGSCTLCHKNVQYPGLCETRQDIIPRFYPVWWNLSAGLADRRCNWDRLVWTVCDGQIGVDSLWWTDWCGQSVRDRLVWTVCEGQIGVDSLWGTDWCGQSVMDRLVWTVCDGQIGVDSLWGTDWCWQSVMDRLVWTVCDGQIGVDSLWWTDWCGQSVMDRLVWTVCDGQIGVDSLWGTDWCGQSVMEWIVNCLSSPWILEYIETLLWFVYLHWFLTSPLSVT